MIFKILCNRSVKLAKAVEICNSVIYIHILGLNEVKILADATNQSRPLCM